MKKLIALLLTAVLAMSCAASLAETAPTTIESNDGSFKVSFQMPEGATLLSGEWSEDGSIYQANIQGQDGLYFYLAIAAPKKGEEGAEETTEVTYNEENGYTDEFLKDMMREMYADDAENFDVDVHTTAYGTKLAVARFNDDAAPSLYVFSIWKGYEIGLTAVNMAEDGTQKQISDEEVQKVVDFLSEVWMSADEAAEAAETPAA